MTRARVAYGILAGVALLAASAWVITAGLERLMRPAPEPPVERNVTAAGGPAPERHITATLFYGSSDGQYLVPVQREVPFAEGAVEQGRQIVLAQLTMSPPPSLVAVVPPGSRLRTFYVSERGDAFVDLGPEIASAHPGGSAAELLTVYAIVNAVAANLPAVKRVQILINGSEIDTLAGHVDLRRPLARNEALVQH